MPARRRARRRTRRRTAVVVGGTAAAVSHSKSKQAKADSEDAQDQAYEQGAADQQAADTQTQQAPSSGDYAKELEKLADLKDKGIITQEEFDAKKKEIMGL